MKTLYEIKQINQKVQVQTLSGPSEIVERLHELGLFQGGVLQFWGQAPFGGPQIFKMGTVALALRKEEALCAQIVELP